VACIEGGNTCDNSDLGDDPQPPKSRAVRARYLRFIEAFVADPAQPARRAYMKIYRDASPATADREASRILKHPWVQAEIDKRLAKILARSEVSARDIVERLKAIAEFDVRRLYKLDRASGKWRMREPHELDDVTARAIESIEIVERPNGVRKVKIKPASKVAALEILARHKGMLKEPERPPIIAEININF
jgi:hypothetical protein